MSLLKNSCASDHAEVYWFCPNIESVYSGGLLTASQQSAVWITGIHFTGFLLHVTLDGSDVIQQWCKFNMGALPSGPCICDEWKTQGQPSGQTAVSHYCLKIMSTFWCWLDVNLINKKWDCWPSKFSMCHWLTSLTASSFLFEPPCFMLFWKPKQIRVYKSQISNAGIRASHALPGGRQLDSQGLKQGEEKKSLTMIRRKLKHGFVYCLVS